MSSDLSRYRSPTGAAFAAGPLDRTSVVNSNILNSKGAHVGVVVGQEVFGLKGQKLYDLKGSNIYKLNGDLVGHLSNARGAEKRLDKATDKLFPSTRSSI